ncbi:MAG: hypothetical protein ACLFVP_02235 [Candidatus Bathyarchaeia archaeon]
MNLRTVKPEIRIIGVSSFTNQDFTQLIGVIYRGAKWLDGVISYRTPERLLTLPLISMINDSKHYQQIRVIAIHSDYINDGRVIDLNHLFEETGKPVLFFIEDEGYEGLVFRGITVQSVGLRREKVEDVLKVSVREDKIPEALRIAGIIRENLKNT